MGHVMSEASENSAVAVRREESALGVEMSQLRFRFAAFQLPWGFSVSLALPVGCYVGPVYILAAW